eukprot:CAMPEP_0184550234 /NCGR_PEP_ID=MMETSP0199_2-20130426/18345_1 /TAXON_ID=1112570 /ORGANISM="Thraustochytrium sp., Strain LLF1b" /LENGTH=1107 /DNA_ID=CAMNT_0026945065 /DNA_START=122 /DNA_END=3445 /DNA_ORIENTATION=-
MGDAAKHAAYDNIKVVVRSRPLNAEEKAANTPSLVTCDQEVGQVAVQMNIGSKRTSKRFNYDMVFGQYSTQADVYKSAIKPVVDEVLLGYNCTVFAYGQTGTGKTHTMEGNVDDPELRGMIPRAVSTIFEALDDYQDAEYTVKVSFLELYNEELQDLLSATDDVKLRILDDKSRMGTGVACHNLEEVMVKSPEDILNYMKKAMAKRQTGETKLNKSSSRSHCIFTMTVHIREVTPEGEDLLKVGKLNLVDLAGSECVGRSGATNQRAREAGNINKSLLTLGRVISALVEKTPHIPYRDSKLTRLLQESLGGRAKTCIIATVAPSVQCLDETLSTLEYASRAKSIKNKPEANQRMTKRAMIKEYAEDIDRLRQELASARAKDGVYLSEMQYNDLVQAKESQKNQIEELEDLMEQRQKEYAELEDRLQDTTDKLEDTEENLQNTQKELTQTSEKLDVTRENLKSQKILVKETRVLVDAHQATEGKLHEGTEALHATIDEATHDVGQLHTKIERKDLIEKENKSTTESFRTTTVASLGTEMNKSSEFFTAQLSNHETLESSLAEMSKLHTEQTQSVLAAITTLSTGARTGVKEICSDELEALKTQSHDQWQDAATRVKSQHDTMKTALDTAKEATLGPLLQLLETALVEHAAKIERHADQLQAQLRASKEAISSFASSHAAAMEAITSKVSQDAESNRRALEEQHQKLKSFAEAEQARVENKSTEIVAQMSQLLNAFKSETQTNLAQMASDNETVCKSTVEAQIRAELEAKKLVQDSVHAANKWCEDNSKTHDDVQQLVDQDNEEMAQQCTAISELAQTARDTVIQQTSVLSGLAKNAETNTLKACEQATAKLDGKIAEMVSLGDSVCERIEHDEEAARMGTNQQESAAAEWLSARAEDSKAQRQVISVFNDAQKNSLKQLEVNCNTFVDNDLKQDEPNGLTPKRKSYKFDRSIPATAPHEELIQQFRDSGLAVADDSDDEESSSNTEEARSADVPVDLDAVEVEENKDAEEATLDSDVENNTPEVAASEEQQQSHQSNERESLTEISNVVNNVVDNKTSEKLKSTEQTQLTEEAIMQMKVADLRKELSQRNESQMGTKATLQQRLLQCI